MNPEVQENLNSDRLKSPSEAIEPPIAPEDEEGYDTEEEEEEQMQPLIEPDDSLQQLQINAEQIIAEAQELHEALSQRSDMYREDEKNCWVCLGCEQDDPTAAWVHPCRCRGTTKWVHQACIQRWVDEKQNGNTNAKVECPQCGFSYSIQFPQPGFVVAILDSGDMLIKKLCPIITGGACVGSIYWTMVTFGAVTFMDTVGHERGVEIMESTDTMVLLVSLPLVPVGLIIGQMIRWEETVIRYLRVAVPQTPLVRSLMPAFAYQPERRGIQSTIPPRTDPISLTRIFCGALFFPTIATFLGATLYKNVPSQLKRTLLGGLTFAVVKGVLKIYHQQHSYIRQCQKQILDCTE